MMKTESNPNKAAQRHLGIAVIAAMALLLAGCVVSSVYPWYTAKDVVFDPALVGQWQSTEPDAKADVKADNYWEFEKLTDQAYRLTTVEGQKRIEFDVHLFKLRGQRFLDCFPRERPDYCLPLHFLLRVGKLSPTFEFRVLDYDWLKQHLASNPKALRHHFLAKKLGEPGDGDLVLTAETAQLQKFLLKHLSDTNAFGEPVVMKRR